MVTVKIFIYKLQNLFAITIERMPLTQLKVRFFLDALGIKCQFGGDEWKCGGPEFPYAKEILTLMRIPQTDQKKAFCNTKFIVKITIFKRC